MNAERLLKLASFLDTLPPHKFDFGSYVDVGDREPLDALAHPEEHCGTTACAIGWCPAIFPEEWVWNPGAEFFPELRCGSSRDVDCCGDTYFVLKDGESFFDLSLSEYFYLFIPAEQQTNSQGALSEQATPADVAAHIRAFVVKGIEEFLDESGDVE